MCAAARHLPLAVSKELGLDVVRLGQELLHKHARIPKAGLTLPATSRQAKGLNRHVAILQMHVDVHCGCPNMLCKNAQALRAADLNVCTLIVDHSQSAASW